MPALYCDPLVIRLKAGTESLVCHIVLHKLCEDLLLTPNSADLTEVPLLTVKTLMSLFESVALL